MVVGPRAVDFLALWRRVPVMTAVVAEGGPGTGRFAERAACMVALEDVWERRRIWSSASMADVLPYIDQLITDLDDLTVVPYAVTTGLATRLAKVRPRCRVVGPEPDQQRWLDNKRTARAALAGIGAPILPGVIVDLPGTTFHELIRLFGSTLVVQALEGSSGLGTTVVRDGDALGRVEPAAEHLVTPYRDGCVINVHVAVTGGGAVASPPSIQLAGLPAIGIPFPIYSGNDFAAAAKLSPPALAAVSSAVDQVANWLAEIGYTGLAGVDLLVDHHACYVLEVNPRLQGSTWLLGEAQERAGLEPMLVGLVLHGRAQPSVIPLQGAQLILRRPEHGPWYGLPGLPRCGAYAWRSGALTFDRPVIGLAECGEDEILVDGLTAVPPDRVDPLAVVSRVASWRQLVETDGRSLTPLARAILEQAYA